MKKRALTILAATVMAASILTGCSGVADIESDYDTESKNLQSMFVVVDKYLMKSLQPMRIQSFFARPSNS